MALLIVYGDNVESPLARRGHPTEKFAGNLGQMVLLLTIHRCFGGLDVVAGAGFYFDDAEHVTIPADEIKFSAVVGRAVVASNHDVAAPAEVEVGSLLTPAPGLQMGRNVFRGKSPGGQPIKGAERGLGDASLEQGEFLRCSG